MGKVSLCSTPFSPEQRRAVSALLFEGRTRRTLAEYEHFVQLGQERLTREVARSVAPTPRK